VGNLGLADGDAGRAGKRQGLGELGAEVGVFPGFDAAMRQSKCGIGVDCLGTQIGDPVWNCLTGSSMPNPS
jgi:hypothetical protein